MKKLFLFSIAISLLITSCSNSEEPSVTNASSNSYKTVTVKRLEQLNDSIKQNYTCYYASRGWLRNLYIVGSDAYGAYKWGKRGARIGALTGTPHGTAIGAAIGGAFGAISSSYKAYKKTENIGYFEPFKIGINELTATYTALERVDENDFEYCLSFPYDGEAIENVGEYHNRALAYMMDADGGILLMGDNLDIPATDPIRPVNYVELTPFERSIVENTEFSAELEADETIFEANGIEDFDFGESESGTIMKLYIEALDSIDGPDAIQGVINLTNQYIAIISDSTTLSEEEKENLYVAFSVGAYSYKYWTEYYGN